MTSLKVCTRENFRLYRIELLHVLWFYIYVQLQIGKNCGRMVHCCCIRFPLMVRVWTSHFLFVWNLTSATLFPVMELSWTRKNVEFFTYGCVCSLKSLVSFNSVHL